MCSTKVEAYLTIAKAKRPYTSYVYLLNIIENKSKSYVRKKKCLRTVYLAAIGTYAYSKSYYVSFNGFIIVWRFLGEEELISWFPNWYFSHCLELDSSDRYMYTISIA